MCSTSRSTRVIAAAAALVLVGACDTSTQPPSVPRGAVALQMEEMPSSVAEYLYTGLTDKRRLFVDNANEWSALWNEVTSIYQPQPDVPAIDFGTESVIVAAMGTRSSGGYSIAIESVHEAEGQLYVTVRETSPGQNCFTTAALTAPVHAVRVPRRTGAVNFVERTGVQNC